MTGWHSHLQHCPLKVSEGVSDEVLFVQHPNAIPVYQRYVAHPDEFESVSFYEFCQWYHVKSDNYKRCGTCGAKPYVVDIWLQFVGNSADAEGYEKFCHAKVFLHHPHCIFGNLLLNPGIQD